MIRPIVRLLNLTLAALIFAGTCITHQANAAARQATAETSKATPAARHQAVLDLRPIGYWPADDGSGEVLRDLSPTANNAVLHHVPWVDGLLDFTGAYQWAEIPALPAYQTPAFSLGGWFYARSPFIGGHWPNTAGMLFFGNQHRRGEVGILLCIRKQEVVDVVSDGEHDVLGTRLWDAKASASKGSPTLPIGQWHHVLYTFEPRELASTNSAPAKEGTVPNSVPQERVFGRGSLYVNGELVASREAVPYKPADRDVLAGSDAAWWSGVDKKSGSLDGSVRDLVWFDRALTADEVTRLYEVTRPGVTPAASTPAPQRTSPLPVAHTPAERAELVALLAGPDEPAAARAALALANAKAIETVPALADALQAELDRNGERVPRIEDLRRNALLRALLDLAPEDPSVLPLLDRGLFRPLFALYDLENPDLREVRDALDAGRPLDAYRTFLRLNPEDPAQNFFTFRDSGRRHRDYSPFFRHGDTIYQINEGVAWQGGERISDADYADLAARIPGFADWRPASHVEHLYRIPLVKIDPSGKKEKVYLGGRDFILDGEDGKILGWSIFVDRDGFIHLFGGQHNRPNPERDYAPGTWETLPASRDRNSPDFPAQMYWVSRKPGDITTMEFAGRQSDPRSVPANYLNYMTIVQHPTHGTYLYGRVDALGWQSWGAFRYDADAQRWHEVGGDPYDLLQNAFAAHPDWRRFLHSSLRGNIPEAPTDLRILAWAWQPPFYNFCRDDWGLRFDRTGRLHVHLQISGLDENGRLVPSGVYAWSDDGGTTFHRADGSPVKLPLTLNPAPDYRSNIRDEDQARWWDTWISLVPSHGLNPSR